MSLNPEIRAKIIQDNIRVHQIESKIYDKIHTEIFNWYEQKSSQKDIKKILSYLSEKQSTVLDIGCGTGNILLKFAEVGCDVTGVDISPEMLEIVQEKADKNHLKVKLIHINVNDLLKNSSQKYDIVSMSSILHHLPDYIETLTRVTELVKSTGIIFITHEPLLVSERKYRLASKIINQLDSFYHYRFVMRNRVNTMGKIDYSYSDYHAEKGCDLDSIINCLQTNDFVVKIAQKRSGNLKTGMLAWLDNTFKFTSDQFKIIAQKK